MRRLPEVSTQRPYTLPPSPGLLASGCQRNALPPPPPSCRGWHLKHVPVPEGSREKGLRVVPKGPWYCLGCAEVVEAEKAAARAAKAAEREAKGRKRKEAPEGGGEAPRGSGRRKT